MKNAIQYRRISERDQSNWSLAGQSETNNSYCDRNNITLLADFADNGRSAKNFDREGWKKLVTYLRANHQKVDFLIVAKYDRLIRNASEGLATIERIEKQYNLRVISVSENIAIDPHSPFFFKLRADMLVNAEFERRVISDRSKYGNWQAKKAGRFLGRAPFGYRNERDENDKPIIVQDSTRAGVFEYLRTAFFEQQRPVNEIKKEIQRLGFNRKGNEAVKRLLLNPVYYGLIECPSYAGSASEIVQGRHTGYFSQYLYQQAVEYFDGGQRQRVIVSEDLPLRGVVRCQCCGNFLTGAKSKGRGGSYFYYKCNGKDCKQNYRNIHAHTQLESILWQLSLSEIAIDYAKSIYKEECEKALKERTAKARKLQHEVDRLTQKLNSVEEKYFSDNITSETYRKWHGIYNRDLTGKQGELLRINDKAGNDRLKLADAFDSLGRLDEVWQGTDVAGKQSLVNSVFFPYIVKTNDGYRTPNVIDCLQFNSLNIKELDIKKMRVSHAQNGKTPISTRNVHSIEHFLQVLTGIAA